MMAQNTPLEVDVKQKARKRSAQSPFLREAFSFLPQGRGGHLFSARAIGGTCIQVQWNSLVLAVTLEPLSLSYILLSVLGDSECC